MSPNLDQILADHKACFDADPGTYCTDKWPRHIWAVTHSPRDYQAMLAALEAENAQLRRALTRITHLDTTPARPGLPTPAEVATVTLLRTDPLNGGDRG